MNQSIERTRNIRITGSDPIDDIDVLVRRLLEVGVTLCTVGKGAEIVALRAVYRALRRKYSLDRELLGEALDHLPAASGLQEGKLCRRLGAEENIHIRKNLQNRLTCFISTPEVPTEVHVEGNQRAIFLEALDRLDGRLTKLWRQCQGDPRRMEALRALIHLWIDLIETQGEEARVPAIIDDLRLTRVCAILIVVHADSGIL